MIFRLCFPSAAASPLTEIALDLGKPVVKNVVALGAFQAITEIFPEDTFRTALRQTLKPDPAIQELNQDAFSRGHESVQEQIADAAN